MAIYAYMKELQTGAREQFHLLEECLGDNAQITIEIPHNEKGVQNIDASDLTSSQLTDIRPSDRAPNNTTVEIVCDTDLFIILGCDTILQNVRLIRARVSGTGSAPVAIEENTWPASMAGGTGKFKLVRGRKLDANQLELHGDFLVGNEKETKGSVILFQERTKNRKRIVRVLQFHNF